MQVVFHLGAPCTDDDLLIKSLLKNRGLLAQTGAVVPPPGRYRTILREAMRALKGSPASEEIQDALLDAILDEEEAHRMILSDPRFVCINRLVVQGAQIWPMIERQTTNMRCLFPDAEIEFAFGMRDPATLIPALFRASRFTDFAEFTANMQPLALTWSEMIRRFRSAHPDAALTVWCNEDTPILWAELLHELSGLDANAPIEGRDDLLETIMEPGGFKRMQAYMEEKPPANEMQRRRIVAAFLDKYAIEDEVELELDAPGWSTEMIDQMSDQYDEDMAEVARIPGVHFITP